MTAEIRVAVSPGEWRVAVTADGVLTAYAIHRPGAPDGVGDVHVGRIGAKIPAMAGAFVTLADAEGFLPDSEGARDCTVGTLLPVRITRAAQGGKGPRLTARALPAAEGPVRLLHRGPHAVARLAAAWPEAPVLVDDPGLLARLRPTLAGRAGAIRAAFPAELEDEISTLAEPTAALPGGARMHVQPTAALTAIDIDAGAATGAAGGKSAQQAALNRALLPALARNIRLRNLSGAILVDLAGMPVKRRQALGPVFAAALAEDPLHPRFLGFSHLGLAEILRPRVHPPLHEQRAGPHAAGLAALREAAARIACAPARALALRASPAVVSALQADTGACADMTARAGRPLALHADPTLRAAGWVLEESE